jgi:hypothetical protein
MSKATSVYNKRNQKLKDDSLFSTYLSQRYIMQVHIKEFISFFTREN